MAEQEMTARDVLADVEAARARLMDAARPEAVAKVAKRGKLPARERIRRLVDAGTFDEIGALVTGETEGGPEASQAERDTSPADGVVVGTARIDGRPAMIVSQDFSVFGGSIGKLGSAKTQRAIRIAIQRGIPMIMLLDGGGHRIQDGQDSRHFANANSFFHDLARASGWIPVVSLMLGAGFAGPTNYAGMSDFVVMVRGISTMGLAGPALVKAGTGEIVDMEEIGGAAAQVDRHGLADLGVATEDEAFAAARRYLSFSRAMRGPRQRTSTCSIPQRAAMILCSISCPPIRARPTTCAR